MAILRKQVAIIHPKHILEEYKLFMGDGHMSSEDTGNERVIPSNKGFIRPGSTEAKLTEDTQESSVESDGTVTEPTHTAVSKRVGPRHRRRRG